MKTSKSGLIALVALVALTQSAVADTFATEEIVRVGADATDTFTGITSEVPEGTSCSMRMLGGAPAVCAFKYTCDYFTDCTIALSGTGSTQFSLPMQASGTGGGACGPAIQTCTFSSGISLKLGATMTFECEAAQLLPVNHGFTEIDCGLSGWPIDDDS